MIGRFIGIAGQIAAQQQRSKSITAQMQIAQMRVAFKAGEINPTHVWIDECGTIPSSVLNAVGTMPARTMLSDGGSDMMKKNG
jgi:hypothetical protein